MLFLYNKIYEAVNTGLQKALIIDQDKDVSVNWHEKEMHNDFDIFRYVKLLLDSNDADEIKNIYEILGNLPDGSHEVSDYTELKHIVMKLTGVFGNYPYNLNWINVRNVKNMMGLFSMDYDINCQYIPDLPLSWSGIVTLLRKYKILENFNADISKWDVSNVTNMARMFEKCKYFNQYLNSWNVSNVTDMQYMFNCCESFNQPINNWDVSDVTDMQFMFYKCEAFNQKLDNWIVTSVTNMHSMFTGCINFNQPLNSWNVENVTNMSHMFEVCSNFQMPLNKWKPKNIKGYEQKIGMFTGCPLDRKYDFQPKFKIKN